MKIKSIYPELLYDGAKLHITFAKGENRAVGKLYEGIGGIDPKKDYEIVIRPKRKMKSIDANNYLWSLLGKLGKAQQPPLSKEEVYISYVKDYGLYTIVPIKADHIEDWRRIWKSKDGKGDGVGWVIEDIGECRNTPGYHNIISYYGSSCYNTKEMSILIDAVVRDCKEQGIETMTPNQILELKQKWGCG